MVTVAVWLVRDCGHFTCQVTANFGAGYCASNTIETLINYTACYHLVFMSFCPPKTIEILKSCDIITFLYSNYCQYVWFEYYFLTSVNLLNNSQNMQGLCKLFDKA